MRQIQTHKNFDKDVKRLIKAGYYFGALLR